MDAVGCCMMTAYSEKFIHIYSWRLNNYGTDAAKLKQAAMLSFFKLESITRDCDQVLMKGNKKIQAASLEAA